MTMNAPLLRILGRIGCGAVSVDGAGQLTGSNRLSEIIVGEFVGADIGTEIELRDGLKDLIASSNQRFRIDSESWIIVARKNRKSLVLYSIPTGNQKDEYESAVIIIVDMEKTPELNAEVLQRNFNLTLAEYQISLLIIDGKTPTEISKIRNISLWTIRTQLASIYSKTKTRRQSELVSLLLRLSILP